MKVTQNDISDLPKLSEEKMENMLSVHKDADGRYFYNLIDSVQIPDNLPDSLYEIYNVRYGDTWPFISYKVYESPNLWWLVLHANNIQDPTVQPVPGDTLKIFKKGVASNIVSQISK